MQVSKADIIARLQREILPLQGYKPVKGGMGDVGLGRIRYAFPNHIFPVGAIHEFITSKREDMAATGGFISGILSLLMKNASPVIWVSVAGTVFPPALSAFNISPQQIIFIDLEKPEQVPWVVEEALKCNGLAAVIGDVKEMDFITSRRLQLAVEQSRVTGFLLRNNPQRNHSTASIAKWKITSLQSELPAGMPGVGYPRWNVELLKVRNGKPGSWQVEWNAGKFRHISTVSPFTISEKKKTG